ncbi:MAG TPA: hypothetical protein VM265_00850, partial [Sphingomicrobium sp.]|nr:hypothetical protein [Sphingomicrobium sp.]
IQQHRRGRAFAGPFCGLATGRPNGGLLTPDPTGKIDASRLAGTMRRSNPPESSPERGALAKVLREQCRDEAAAVAGHAGQSLTL